MGQRGLNFSRASPGWDRPRCFAGSCSRTTSFACELRRASVGVDPSNQWRNPFASRAITVSGAAGMVYQASEHKYVQVLQDRLTRYARPLNQRSYTLFAVVT